MYSKFSTKKEDSAFQIPEHYSGCAFSPNNRSQPKSQPTFLEVAKPSPPHIPLPTEPEENPSPLSPPIMEEERKQADSHDPPPSKETFKEHAPSPFASLFGNMGNAFPHSHGLGFEELLILGLILLLSRNEGDSDAILLLGLLLFCG